MRSVIIQRQGQEPVGLSICGGIGGASVNPKDTTDEGIFIERVERTGPAAASDVGLHIGLRILEVNLSFIFSFTFNILFVYSHIYISLNEYILLNFRLMMTHY